MVQLTAEEQALKRKMDKAPIFGYGGAYRPARSFVVGGVCWQSLAFGSLVGSCVVSNRPSTAFVPVRLTTDPKKLRVQGLARELSSRLMVVLQDKRDE